jgi:hypothetical protein
MKATEIIELGESLGMSYYHDSMALYGKWDYRSCSREAKYVVFDGNGQRFEIHLDWDDEKIFKVMGESLKLMGRQQLKMEIKNLLSIIGE